MTVHPNVKLNLGLSVLRRRPDGYHDLESLLIPYFGIQDTLEIIEGGDYTRTGASLAGRYGADCIAQGMAEDGKAMITIARSEGVNWNPLEDLTLKAYRLLDADFDLPPVKIYLEKTAPVGAGLGGGSADAAFALRALDALFGLSLSTESLAAYAARLGSDCPFFIYNRPMFARGRGEILTPACFPALDDLGFGQAPARRSIKVLTPPVSVSTAEAYKGVVPRESAGRVCPPPTAASLEEILNLPPDQWRGRLVNDFEKSVFAAHPRLATLKEELYARGALYAAMSGSGSALFGIF